MKELQGTDQKEFSTEKVIKKKGDRLYVEWKGYDNSFNVPYGRSGGNV